MANLLESKQLFFSWGGQGWMKGLNLSLESGHIYGLLGRNGAGKTTLIKLLSGCLKSQSGEVRWIGTSGTMFDRRPETLQEIMFVAESSALPPIPAAQFGKLAGALYPRYSHDKYLANLSLLEVLPHESLAKLSFGQKRKAHIAFALATDAKLLFLDEPSNGLDIASQIVLRKMLINHLTPEHSMVISTHHVREFETIIDKALVLDGGAMLAQAEVAELQAQPKFSDLENWYAELTGIRSPHAHV